MKLVTLSSTESEYVATCEDTRDLKYLRYLLESIGFEVEMPNTMYEDNMSCIKMLNSDVLNHGTSKHISPKFNFVREEITNGNIQVVYLPTEEQPADILTKALSFRLHNNNVERMMCCNDVILDENVV